MFELGVDLEELLELLRLTDRDEERTSHTRLAQARRLALPVECVVPAQGSAEVAQEDDHRLALVADDLAHARAAAVGVRQQRVTKRAPRDAHVVHEHTA